MAGLTISGERLINGFQAVGAIGAIGGGLAFFVCAILRRDIIYPLTVMALGFWTWENISNAKFNQKVELKNASRNESFRQAQKQVDKMNLHFRKKEFDKQVDVLGLRSKKDLQDRTTDSAGMDGTAGKVARLTFLPTDSGINAECLLGLARYVDAGIRSSGKSISKSFGCSNSSGCC